MLELFISFRESLPNCVIAYRAYLARYVESSQRRKLLALLINTPVQRKNGYCRYHYCYAPDGSGNDEGTAPAATHTSMDRFLSLTINVKEFSGEPEDWNT